jgi:hypothetical protein
MTPKEKIAYIEIQVRACERGEINALVCPYCGDLHTKGAPLCCGTFAKACSAVIGLQVPLKGQPHTDEHIAAEPPIAPSIRPSVNPAHSF